MVELNEEEKKELLIGIRKDVSDILKELVGNIRKDILEIIETNFYDDVKYEIVLEKTEKLLKNYKSLREHVNNIKITKSDIKEAEESQIRQMMKNLFTDDELYFEKLYKSRANTEILVRFLENIFRAYKEEGVGSTSLPEIRKRNLLENYYIQGLTQQEVLLDYSSQKTFYKDRQELIEDLAPRICGVDGLKI